MKGCEAVSRKIQHDKVAVEPDLINLGMDEKLAKHYHVIIVVANIMCEFSVLSDLSNPEKI